MNAVRGDRERRGRLHGGRVARGRDRNEGGRAEQHGLAPRRSPVHASLHVEAQREKRREQHEDAVADEPDVTRLGLEEHPRDRGRLERGRRAPFEARRLEGDLGEPGREGREREDARPGEQASFPLNRRRAIRAAGEHDDRRGADEEDRAGEMRRADGEPECQHRASVQEGGTGVERRALFG